MRARIEEGKGNKKGGQESNEAGMRKCFLAILTKLDKDKTLWNCYSVRKELEKGNSQPHY